MAEQSTTPSSVEPTPAPQATRPGGRRRKLLIGVVGVCVLAVLLVFGVPWVEELLNTVSTDDAYVNGHVTFVAPGIAGQMSLRAKQKPPRLWWG